MEVCTQGRPCEETWEKMALWGQRRTWGEATEGTSPAARLILDFQPPELQINFSCSWQTDGETMKTERDYFLEFQKSLQMVTAAMNLKDLLLGRKAMINLDSILKSRDITLPTKFHLVKPMIFPVVMYGCESWIIRKAEHWRTDAFELWCWRRLLRVPWTERRSNLFILKEISPEYSLEGLMLKLKLQSFGLLMWRTDSLEKTDPDAGKDWRQEEKRTAKDKMAGWHHWLDGHEFEQAPGVDDGQGSLACCSPWDHKELDTTEQLNWTETTHSVLWCFAAEALRNKYRQLWSSQSFVQNFLTVSSFFALSRLPSWGLSGTSGSELTCLYCRHCLCIHLLCFSSESALNSGLIFMQWTCPGISCLCGLAHTQVVPFMENTFAFPCCAPAISNCWNHVCYSSLTWIPPSW